MCKLVAATTFSLLTLFLSSQANAADIVGGSGSAAGELILDWGKYKADERAHKIKFSLSLASTNIGLLQNGKIDFAILDHPISDDELAKLRLVQFPFALSGVAIVVNLPNTMAGTLRLDGPTIGKIFSGEITHWDDTAIIALNPKHDLPNKPITIVHSGEASLDYPVFNAYAGGVSEKWKSAEASGGKREWPANSVLTDSYSTRIAALKSKPYSIGYLPMQHMSQTSISTVHIQNRDGKFIGLSDTSIIASTATTNLDDRRSANLSLINKSGSTTWPISYFTIVAISQDRIKEDKITQLLGTVTYGLKFGALKTTIYNYVAIPDQLSKSIIANIENAPTSSGAAAAIKTPTRPNSVPEAAAGKKNSDDESLRQRNEANAAQEQARRIEEKNRAAKQLADELAREQAIKEARAAKLASEEAIKTAKAAKLEAEALAEKNRLIAKAEKDKADKEKAEKERIEKEQADKEKAIQMRNQKDEDPLEAYRRSLK